MSKAVVIGSEWRKLNTGHCLHVALWHNEYPPIDLGNFAYITPEEIEFSTVAEYIGGWWSREYTG